MVVAPHSTDPAVGELDAVAMTLGPRFAALRSYLLAAVVPRLDETLGGVAEEDELPGVLDALAADPHDLLDPRRDGTSACGPRRWPSRRWRRAGSRT